MNALDKYPIDFVMDLNRKKLSSGKKGDVDALKKLQQNYPDLFSNDFEKIITNLSLSINDIHNRYGIDFRK